MPPKNLRVLFVEAFDHDLQQTLAKVPLPLRNVVLN